MITLCVAERETFKPVSLKLVYSNLYAQYDELVEKN